MIITSCSKKSDIDHIDIYYLPKWTSTHVPVKCGELYGDWKPKLQYNRVEDERILMKIEQLYTKIEKSQINDETEDMRIRCMIHFKQGRIDTLCLGELYGMYLNDNKKKDIPELLNLIKTAIDYENSDKRIEQLELD